MMMKPRLLTLTLFLICINTSVLAWVNPFTTPWSLTRRHTTPAQLNSPIVRALSRNKFFKPKLDRIRFGAFIATARESFDDPRVGWFGRIMLTHAVRREAKKRFPQLLGRTAATSVSSEYFKQGFVPEQHALADTTKNIDDQITDDAASADINLDEIDMHTGLAKDITKTSQFLVDLLTEAVKRTRRGSHDAAMVDLGIAFHTVEDWFTNSNFLLVAYKELAGTSLDIHPMVGDSAILQIPGSLTSVSPVVLATRFNDNDHAIHTLRAIKEQLIVEIDDATRVKKNFLGRRFNVGLMFKRRKLKKISADLLKFEKHQLRIDANDFRDGDFLDPPQGMVSSAFPDHPLHDLAAECSRVVISALAANFKRYTETNSISHKNRLVSVARSLFFHPNSKIDDDLQKQIMQTVARFYNDAGEDELNMLSPTSIAEFNNRWEYSEGGAEEAAPAVPANTLSLEPVVEQSNDAEA